MSATVYRDTIRTARKAHRCDCCPATIQPGEKYVSHFSITDGDAYSAKRCLPCQDVVRAIFDANDSDFLLYDAEMHEDVCSLESDAETRPLALAWHARCGRPARYVDSLRFDFDWSESERTDSRIVTIATDGWPRRTHIIVEVRGTLGIVDVDSLRARFVSASDDELLALVDSARAHGEPLPAWPEVA